MYKYNYETAYHDWLANGQPGDPPKKEWFTEEYHKRFVEHQKWLEKLKNKNVIKDS